jgi:altronate dehydratase small subunit
MAERSDKKIDAIMVAESDNVATCLHDIESGLPVSIMLGKDIRIVTAADPIPRGHKIAMLDITEGDSIRKYGEVIGKASLSIGEGHHVHIHNVVD